MLKVEYGPVLIYVALSSSARCGSIKVLLGQVLPGGVLRGSVLSSLARQGVSWRGKVLSGRARHGEVLHGNVGFGSILAFLGFVRSCPVRLRNVEHGVVRQCKVKQGSISVLRGLAWHGTVLSCLVRQRMARFFRAWFGMVVCCPLSSGKATFFVVWHGVLERGPVRLGQVVFGRLWHFMVRSGIVGRSTAERGFVLHGKVSSWLGEVLIGIVGFIGALYCLVRSYCGMVRSVEALHGILKYGPVKHCMAGLGAIWSCDVQRGGVWSCLARYAKALFWKGGAVQSEVRHAKLSLRSGVVRCGTVLSGFARLRAVGQALLRRHYGLAWPGEVGRCMASFALALLRLGSVLLSQVRRVPVLQGFVRLGVHGYGGVTT